MKQEIIDFANALKRAFCTHCMPAMDFEEYDCGYQEACSYHKRIDETLELYAEEAEPERCKACSAHCDQKGECNDQDAEEVAL